MAIKNLDDLYMVKRRELGTGILFLGGKSTDKVDYPVAPEQFYKLLMAYYVYINNYFPVINVSEDMYPGLGKYNVSSLNNCKANKGLVLVHPVTEQYRVRVCTELYNKGVSLQYIKRFMSHLSHEMEGYYSRITIDNPQEDMNYSMMTFRQIISGEIEPLGGSSDIVSRIDKFIKDGKYNVASDLTTICQ
jgi:hypothetical protein